MSEDVVKKITITATGENVDSTRASIEKLSAATTQLSNNAADSAKAYRAQTDALNSNTSAMGSLWQQIVAGGVILYALKLAWDAIVWVVKEFVELLTKAAQLAADMNPVAMGVKYVGGQWENTTERLKEYIDLAGKAGAIGVSTDFYQSQTLAAEKLKITNDSLIKQMETLRSATHEQLGGSSGQNRVDELVSFGNFKGNTGVDELKNATTLEEKYKAVVSLVNQATDAGERLAAIDVAKTMLGKDAADNLQKDSDYFRQIASESDKLKEGELVKSEDVSRALDLQNRLDAAEATISKKWFPAQRDGLNPVVMFFKELWVDIVELVASTFNWVEKITKSILSIPSNLMQKFRDWRHAGEAEGPIQETPEQALARGTSALRTGLQNRNTVSQARDQTLAASDRLRPDKSKSTLPDEPDPEKKDAFDRAEESLLKYIEVTKAAATSIDLTVGEQEKLKAIAQLTAAGLKDGLTPEAAKAKAELSGMGEAAGVAAMALAKAKVASEIKFGRNTALLSQEDVAIATRLKGLYPDVATALASVEAEGIRTNTALTGLSGVVSGQLTTGLTDILDDTKSVKDGFKDMSKVVIRAIEEMIVKLLIVGPLMRALQSGMGGMFGSGGGSSSVMDASGIPGFASGTDNAPGGWAMVGENGPELMNLPRGAKVLPNGVSPDGGNISAPVQISIDATGADAAGLARVQEQLAALRTSLPSTIVATVKKAKTNRVL